MSGKEPLKIVNIDRMDGDALIVTYSNDTTAIYTTEQIVALTRSSRCTASESLIWC